MKRAWMWTGLLVGAAAATLVVFLPRTAERAAAPSGGGGEAEEAWSFKEGRGVRLAPSAAESLGVRVELVAVEDLPPPRNGLRCQVYREAGESVDGATAAASLWMPLEGARRLVPDQPVQLRRGGDVWSGRVASVQPMLMEQAREVEVLLTIRDAAGRLRVGDWIEATLGADAEPRRGVMVVPESALVESVRGVFVYVLNGGAYLRTPVHVGARREGRVEIAEGLFEGDEVVASGASGLWMVELQAVNGGKGCADGH